MFSMQITVFWDVTVCGFVCRHQIFLCPEDGGSSFFWNTGDVLKYMALYFRRHDPKIKLSNPTSAM
jgi:hypothetical protein